MISFEQLVEEAPLPCIVHWKQNHFVVVYDIKKNKKAGYRIYVADPALGLVTYDENETEDTISADDVSDKIYYKRKAAYLKSKLPDEDIRIRADCILAN